ncbi:tail fiber domain-containing protein [Flavobacterium sp.]|uniref:tail fiber domain-containing protein n=1 Tax=Flavobacterium sp. TaxID=239 RepID=UPI0026328639|nr:tail fiber domain-containing protein [Flavobacterium sp.]
MKKLYFLLLICFATVSVFGQVGINTTDPKAQLEIKSSSETTPLITDGLLIPKVNVFPATNPTIDQQGMLVYLKNVSGTDQPGFYYWNFGTLDWIPINSGSSGGTLDQAYDFGGAGNGKTITADAGAVLINGTDGLVSTGTVNSGVVVPSGPGTRMVWNPRKAAFRAGSVPATGAWDDANIGFGSAAFGNNVVASGSASMAFGSNNTASGSSSTVLGANNIASSSNSTAFGNLNNATGINSTAFGQTNIASGRNAIATGFQNTAGSFCESVFGIGATDYTISTNGVNQFQIANLTDRLFVVGNALDLNNNNFVDSTERKDALVILKNGATGVGSSLPEGLLDVKSTNNGVLIPRVALTSVLVQAPVLNPQTGNIAISTLIYNTATNGVAPNNVYPGFYYWNGAKWTRFDVDGENNSKYYTVVGTTQDFTNTTFSALDQMTINFTPKDDTVLVNFSAAGFRFDDGFQDNVIFFQITLNGIPVTGWQTASKQSIVDVPFSTLDITIWESNFSYPITVPIGIPQTVAIQWSCPNALMNNSPSVNHVAFGQVYKSYRSLTVIDPNGGGGIVGSPPVTTNLWALNGNTATNSLVNFVGTADNQPLVLKSNNLEGLRIATNSNVGLGTTNPFDKLHVVGNIRMVDGNEAAGKVLTSDTNGTATWQVNPGNNAWGLSGNAGTNETTNFIGTTDDVDVVFKRNNSLAGLLGVNNTSFGRFSLGSITSGTQNTALGASVLSSNTTGSNNTANGTASLTSNTTGNSNVAIGHQSLIVNGIGNNNTATGAQSLTSNTSGSNNTSVGFGSLNQVTTGSNNTGLGNAAQVASATASNQVRIGNTAVTSASIQVPWTITSDKRWKSNIQPSNLGLDFIKQLNPVFYTRKDVQVTDGKTTILESTTNPTTEYGFIAQELESTLNKFDTKYNGIISKDDAGMYGVRYNDLIAPMVKAIQEQQVIIENQKTQLEAQSKTITEILKRLELLETSK